MSYVEALLENEEINSVLEENQDVILETEEAISHFPKVLKSFILNHPTEFLAESIEETYKNIRVFTEVATSQFIQEVTTLYGNAIVEGSEEPTASASDYI